MSAPSLAAIAIGDVLPVQQRATDIIQAFLYGAVMFNAHRIHYEIDYAQAEGHAGLIVPGPLLGDWLGQCAEAWLEEAGRVLSLRYSNRLGAIVGETFTVGGTVASVDRITRTIELNLWVKNARDEIITPGSARVSLSG